MSNLLSPQEIKHIKLLYRKRVIVVAFRLLIVLSIIAGVCLVPSYIYSKQEESDLLATKAMYEQRETGELKQSLISAINDINTRLTGFNETTFSSPIVASFIDPIMKARVASVYISKLDYATTANTSVASVEIAGVATSREDILTFAGNLKNIPGVTAVDVPITNFIKESNMPFTITINVNLK